MEEEFVEVPSSPLPAEVTTPEKPEKKKKSSDSNKRPKRKVRK